MLDELLLSLLILLGSSNFTSASSFAFDTLSFGTAGFLFFGFYIIELLIIELLADFDWLILLFYIDTIELWTRKPTESFDSTDSSLRTFFLIGLTVFGACDLAITAAGSV